jgi:UDP-galactopyranose mutase
MPGYDYIVVGCGMFGATFARLAADQGRTVLIVDKRKHIAGNCYSEQVAGVEVHRYGPHIFHTSSEAVWRFANRFTRFNHYVHHGRVRYQDRTFSFPLNLATLAQLWGVQTPADAQRKLAEVRIDIPQPRNLRDWVLSQVGEELYEIFIRGYTTKQWGRDPSELPASIIRRIPIRMTFDNRYFDDLYQGIPMGGYTRWFENMLDDTRIHVQLGVDFFESRAELRSAARSIVYTGKVDEYFDYRFGELEYRSLRFETETLAGDFQGAAIMNYTEASVPFTRITEHKHFAFGTGSHTVITREYPCPSRRESVPFYPVRDQANSALYERYQAEAARCGVLFGGRLATYQYYDIHQVLAQAMTLAAQEFGPAAQSRPAA